MDRRGRILSTPQQHSKKETGLFIGPTPNGDSMECDTGSILLPEADCVDGIGWTNHGINRGAKAKCTR